MVPASTLMYGSIFCSVTRKPRASSSAPIEAAARPLPRDETTPPVTKMYFGANSSSFRGPLSDVLFFHGTACQGSVETRVSQLGQDARDRRPARHAKGDDVIAAQRRGARIKRGEPVDRRADCAVAGQPEPRELGRCASTELARPLARRAGRGEPRGERRGTGVRPLERGQRTTREAEPREERAAVRARGGQRERRKPDRVGVEAAAPGPGHGLRHRAETAPTRGREPIARVQQTERSRAPEAEEDSPVLRLAPDPIQLAT